MFASGDDGRIAVEGALSKMTIDAGAMKDFFLHGCRHPAETKMAELKIATHIRDRLFDHAEERGSARSTTTMNIQMRCGLRSSGGRSISKLSPNQRQASRCCADQRACGDGAGRPDGDHPGRHPRARADPSHCRCPVARTATFDVQKTKATGHRCAGGHRPVSGRAVGGRWATTGPSPPRNLQIRGNLTEGPLNLAPNVVYPRLAVGQELHTSV